MRWVGVGADKVWFAKHETMGLIMFDPVLSQHERPDIVVLYLASGGRWVTFDKVIVKQKLAPRNIFDKKYPLGADKTLSKFAAVFEQGRATPVEPEPLSPNQECEGTKATYSGDDSYTREDWYVTHISSAPTRAYDPSSGMHNISVYYLDED